MHAPCRPWPGQCVWSSGSAALQPWAQPEVWLCLNLEVELHLTFHDYMGHCPQGPDSGLPLLMVGITLVPLLPVPTSSDWSGFSHWHFIF